MGPQVEDESPQQSTYRERPHVVPYRAILDVAPEVVRRVSLLLYQERRRRGTRRSTRALTCYKQAVLVVRWFREGAGADALARDNSVSLATVYRYTDEGAEVLADQAPELDEALRAAREDGELVILDGKLFESDRCAERNEDDTSDLWFSGHKHRHGANIQFLADSRGEPRWTSDGEPGSVPDITAARIHVLPRLRAAMREGMTALADAGYDGAGAGICTPLKRPAGVRPDRLHHDNRARDLLLRGLRCLGERAVAVLTQRWKVLRHITRSPSKIGNLVKAALTLTLFEKSGR